MKKILLLGFLGLLFFGCQKKTDNDVERQVEGRTATGAAVDVMDTATVAKKLETITADNNLVFSNLTFGETPQKGDIIVSASSSSAPYGFLYKVKEVHTDGNKTTVVTEPATVEEAVEKATVNKSVELTGFTEIETEDGVTVAQSSEVGTRAVSIGVKIDVDKTIPLYKNGGGSVKAVIKGSFEFKGTLDCQMEVDNWTLHYLKLCIVPQFKSKLTASIEGSLKDSVNVRIATFKTEPIFFLIGGFFPLMVNPEIAIDVVITVKGEIKIQATLVDLDYSKTAGCEYKNGSGFSLIWQDSSKPGKFLDDADVSLTMSGEVKLEPRLGYKLKIYNSGSSLGLYSGFYTKLKLDDLKFNPEIAHGEELFNPKLTLSCGISVVPEAELNIFSKKIAKWEPTVNLVGWTIWERQVFPEFTKTTVTPNANTATVSCTIQKMMKYLFFVEQHGFVYGKTTFPTIDNKQCAQEKLGGIDFTNTSGTTKAMSVLIKDLDWGTTYYIRPYFTNLFGTFYGAQESFEITTPKGEEENNGNENGNNGNENGNNDNENGNNGNENGNNGNENGNSDGIEMVYVQGGTFTMGCTGEQGNDCFSKEKPAHPVTLSGYYIGKYEITQAQWKAVMGSNPSYFKGDNLPVETVSWNDVQEFIRKLNAQTGKNYRLPTEAEWEYAARGGATGRGYKYSGSNNIDNVAWYWGNADKKTHPVGTKQANELGIYDMSGNVWEWCNDWYGDYGSSSQTNPTGSSSGAYRVIRGGNWNSDAEDCRVSNRNVFSPGDVHYGLGLRLASGLK